MIGIGWMIFSWALSPTWSATSLAECRSLVGELHGKACWGVIRERWIQLLVGFYPRELIWRPVLGFVILSSAVYTLLRIGGCSKLKKYAVGAFLVTPYLLWGGPLATPIVYAIAGVFVCFVLFGHPRRSRVVLALVALSGAVAIVYLGLQSITLLPDELSSFGLQSVSSREFGGFLISFLIGLSAIIFSLPLGIGLALGRISELPLFRTLSIGFIEFIRGVPLITLLFIASTLLTIFMPPGTNFDILIRVIIMVTLFAAAYIAEIVRGALAAVPKGQTEGAASLGLNYWQTQRLIILPQALKISIPGIVSTFIAVFKDTTLVSIIGLLDPLGLSNNIRADSAWTGIVWEIYGFAVLIFFIFCFAMSQYSTWDEGQIVEQARPGVFFSNPQNERTKAFLSQILGH